MGSGHIDDFNLRVGDELVVGSVSLGRTGGLDLYEELLGPLLGARRGCGNDLVTDIVDVAGGGGIGEQILGEC